MFDIINQSIQSLLILDSDYLPLLLDYAKSNGWDYLVLFLLESDSLCSKRNQIQYDNIYKLIESFSISKDIVLTSSKALDVYIEIERLLPKCNDLLQYNIPFIILLDYINNILLKKISIFISNSLINSNDNINQIYWIQFKKQITKDVKIDLIDILNDITLRYYIIKYYQINNYTNINLCLNGWLDIKKGLSININKDKTNDIYNQSKYLLQSIRDIYKKYLLDNSISLSIGISDTIRLDIISLINYTSYIRLNDIESIDKDFLSMNINKIIEYLSILEIETYNKLYSNYLLFIDESIEYIELLSYIKIKRLNRIKEENDFHLFISTGLSSYLPKNISFSLSFAPSIDIPTSLSSNCYILWTDPTSDGKTYIAYKHFILVNNVIKESIYDIYINGSYKSNDYISAIDRYIGKCTISLYEVINQISLRLLVQILMLILTDKSVVIMSRYCDLLNDFNELLPRIVWPFRILISHNIIKIYDNSNINVFKDFINSSDGFNIDYRSIPTITFISTGTYSHSLDETDKDKLLNRKDTLVVDIDSCRVLTITSVTTTDSSNTCATTELKDDDNKYRSKLFDNLSFHKYNSTNYIQLQKSLNELVNNNVNKNQAIELIFLKYWTKLILYAIPQSLHYHKSYQVISCNIKDLLKELVNVNDVELKNNLLHGPGFYHNKYYSLKYNDNDSDSNAYNNIHDDDNNIDLCFRLEMLSYSSYSLLDLIARHGFIIDSLNF